MNIPTILFGCAQSATEDALSDREGREDGSISR